MMQIEVHGSRTYTVSIGAGLLRTAGETAAAAVQGRRALLVSDTNVFPLWGKTVLDSLAAAGFAAQDFVFPAGEASKTPETLIAAVRACAAAELTRDDLIVALGGGVTGDLAGLAAALYLRGVAVLQLPTSLLAMVDSSVGGKTAVDLPEGKNLLGAFHQPAAVLCDTGALSTLPAADFACGCGEIVKYAVLTGGRLAALVEDGIRENLEEVAALCVACKRDLVEADEFDRGARQLLNLGHTIGHAVEQVSGFAVPHGCAVAAGLCRMARAAAAQGLCSTADAARIAALCEQYGLPTDAEYPDEALYAAALHDKKRRSGTISLVVPHGIGDCRVERVPLDALRDWIALGRERGERA